jgi:hypothetical protein
MAFETGPLGAHILSMLEHGRNTEEIVQELVGQGHEERFVQNIVAEAKKLHYAKKRTNGLTLIMAGGVICLLSFAFSINSYISDQPISWALYGLTSLGTLVIFAGFIKVF